MSHEYPSKSLNENVASTQSSGQELQTALEQIGGALRGLKFGSVNVIVQDGLIVQIDRTEKVRFRNDAWSN